MKPSDRYKDLGNGIWDDPQGFLYYRIPSLDGSSWIYIDKEEGDSYLQEAESQLQEEETE